MAAGRVICGLSRLSLNSPVCVAAPHCFTSHTQSYYTYQDPNYKYVRPNMGFKQKHYNPKFKRDRKLKFIKIDFPDVNEDLNRDKLTQEEIRSKMKEKGLQPVRPWQEKPLYISSTSGTFEAYVPPEGDGKMSATTTEGAKQKLVFLEKKGKSMMAIRQIRKFDEEFDPNTFAEEAQQIYINTHESLANFDKVRLHQCVTERAYPTVTHEMQRKTLRWQFLGSLEPPRVVHVRCTNMITKDNIFSQVTVRFHTKQTLAVYDRFGRLQYGSEVVARDVLEYVVFEKHVAHTYGSWRIHDKIIPDWLPPRHAVRRTYRVEEEVEEEEEQEQQQQQQEAPVEDATKAVAAQ